MLPQPLRARFAQGLGHLGLLLLPALVVSTPANLLPFGLLLLVSTVMVPDLLWRARADAGRSIRVLAWLMLAVLAAGLLSVVLFEHGFRDVDNRSRFFVMPWIALWVCALELRLRWLWRGAVVGLLLVFGLSLRQVLGGAPRADLFTNAIVLADMVVMLLVLALFCRPHGVRGWAWGLPAAALGCATLVLTGSRGALLALLAVFLVMALTLRWGSLRRRLLILAALLGLSVVAVVSVPELRHQVRLTELHSDVQRLERGDADSSAGARVERLQVAWDTFLDHPLTGVGVGHFDNAMQRLPVCRDDPLEPRCHLGHAHNDLAEWGATQGVLGALLLLAVYGVPLWLFLWLHRHSGRATFRGPAAAGVMIVVCYVLCGLTQSMFAHQITASFYASIVGVLAGLSRVEGLRHQRNRA
ncbi:O-antigen ligase family protein [Stenotrophomonas sp. CFBP 13718]|uniref:O-antigen ligase family protein n=1 Tax=Stenotrophomonas sp. CFBP 13718 TaxID=2775304 RepID=UPI0020180026|nr:O-antigen ligase family protein [Stenotrophomonas sp. CFBP 13718]